MATLVTAPVRASSNARRSPLALWHLLSLDAPAVAALWTLLFARAFHIAVPASGTLALALAVWMIYAADRLSDALYGGDLKQRHYFHLAHRRGFAVVFVCAAPLLADIVVHLPRVLRAGWLSLAFPLLLYVVAVHGFHRARVPKEAVVGLIFGLAATMPEILHGTIAFRSVLPSMLLFAAVCYFNGVAISRWEQSPGAGTDACTAWLAQRLNVTGATLACVSVLCLVQRHGRAIALASLLSTGLLLLLERFRPRFDGVHLRALADAALLTPLVVWPFTSLLSST